MRRFVAIFGLVLGVCLVPPVADALFVLPTMVGDVRLALRLGEQVFLCFGAAVLCLASLAAVAPRWSLSAGPVVLLGVLQLGLTLELGTRVVARQIWPFPDATNPLERLGVWTYPENQRLVPHPFLQYVKSGPRQTGDPPADQTKEPNTLRIITLGGSTTDNEWPMTLGDWLQAHAPRESGSWDVVNLATQGYSTAHSLATLALNGLDYEPDVVLVHHGWNDGMAWGAPEGVFRGDYWHALDTVTPPRIPDRFLVRASVLYRWLAYGTESVPEWATLNNWRPWPWEPRPDHGTPRELATYRRNLESIVAVARHHGAHPVFVTIPHSSSYQGKESARLADANAVTRELAGDLGIDLLDLEADWSEEDQRHFVDLAHLHSAGLLVKAEYVGRFLADLEVLRVE